MEKRKSGRGIAFLESEMKNTVIFIIIHCLIINTMFPSTLTGNNFSP